jgi:diaminopimelate epimerase
MRFTKMHGLGNDFIMIDCLADNPDLADLERRAVSICGSEAEMCGNGIRCLAKYLYDHGATKNTEIAVDTLAGIKILTLSVAYGRVDKVRVDMGEPEFRRGLIPMLGDGCHTVKNELLRAAGHDLAVTCVSMGNPHCVTFVDDVAAFPVTTVGPEVEHHAVFPKRTNVEFVQVIGPAEIRMRVWERGAGETLACGTGACASAIASALNGKTSRQVLVHLAGGDLEIDWAEDNHVFMTGPATEVFAGEFAPSELA